jgi:hypothetical protein
MGKSRNRAQKLHLRLSRKKNHITKITTKKHNFPYIYVTKYQIRDILSQKHFSHINISQKTLFSAAQTDIAQTPGHKPVPMPRHNSPYKPQTRTQIHDVNAAPLIPTLAHHPAPPKSPQLRPAHMGKQPFISQTPEYQPQIRPPSVPDDRHHMNPTTTHPRSALIYHPPDTHP